MLSKPQTLADVQVEALRALLAQRQDDYTWAHDEAATTAALETIYEYLAGPDPLCYYSSVRQNADGCTERQWFHQYDVCQSEHAQQLGSDRLWDIDHSLYTSADILRRNRLGNLDAVRNDGDAWATVRWERLSEIAHPDVHVAGRSQLSAHRTPEPWLNAQIGYFHLHDLWFSLNPPNELSYRVKVLLDADSAPPWNSPTVTDLETTAIVAQFLCHKCTRHAFAGSSQFDKLSEINKRAIDWLITQQSSDGSWGASPHITSHCIRALTEHAAEHKACLLAVMHALEYLLTPRTLGLWNQLRTYNQIEVLLSVIRVSKMDVFYEPCQTLQIKERFRQPRVFISYGGCDADFAKKLAIALEERGIAVWIAEWDIDYGDDILEEIQRGLEATKSFVIILSPESVIRPWVRKELSTAFNDALSGPGKLIVPLVYKKCEAPRFLRTHKMIDFTDSNTFEDTVDDLARRLTNEPRKRK